MAEWQPLRVLVPESTRCHLTINPLAGEPYGRPFISFNAGISVSITPSVLVPGGGVNARDLKIKFVCGGEGPDGFFVFCSNVLCANWEHYSVIYLFL
jgi:hypothetical protein